MLKCCWLYYAVYVSLVVAPNLSCLCAYVVVLCTLCDAFVRTCLVFVCLCIVDLYVSHVLLVVLVFCVCVGMTLRV